MLRKTSFVIVLGAAATPASATLLIYEPFDYAPVGTELSTADGAGGWLKVAAGSTLEPTIAAGSLGQPSLPWTPSGNSVAMTGGGTAVQASSTRQIPGQPYESEDQPTLYYSVLFNVSDVTGTVGGGGSFVAGFRRDTGTGGLNNNLDAGAPLLIRTSTTTPGEYELGSGLTASTNPNDRNWDTAQSYGANETLLLVFSYQFISGAPDIAKMWVNPDLTLSEAANSEDIATNPNTPLRVVDTTIPPDGHGITDGKITNIFLRNNGSAPDAFQVDELRVTSSWDALKSTALAGIWLGGTGDWSDSTKWSLGVVPNASNVAVQIDAGNTGVASVVTLDQDATVFSATANAGDTLNIPAGRTLALSSTLTTSGVVNNSGNLSAQSATISGGELRYDAGAVALNGALTLNNAATLTMAAGADKVLKSATLSISSDSKIDLSDNKLVVLNGTLGTATAGTYNGVQGDVQRAYNSGAWNGPGGLMTSQPNAGPTIGTTTIGVATAGAILFIEPTATGTWAGQSVNGSSVIAMYTYAGDLNFDGRVDAQDYGIIDNWVQFPGTDGYTNGDINYDGVIDAADYGIIDNTIQLQGPPLPTGASVAGIVAVPEPAGAVASVAAAGLLLNRRRRRVRSVS
jgi:hypothetical protein